MGYEIFKSASEIKLAHKVNEYVAAGATVLGWVQIGVEKILMEGTKKRKINQQMFYQTMLIPDGVVEKIDLGDDDIETIIT
jgi:hypothetical protein